MPQNSAPLPDFTRWPSFPFEGDMRIKKLAAPVAVEPPRSGEDAADCVACNTPDDAYIWVSERWRVRAMDRPTGLPIVLILECRSHLDLGDLPNLLAAELGVMTVRLERAIRSLDEVARVHVNRWGDGSAHLHMWFLARPYGLLQLRGTFLSLWDDILPVIPEQQWRENLALVAAWLEGFGGHANAEPPHIQWQSPGTISDSPTVFASGDFDAYDSTGAAATSVGIVAAESAVPPRRPADLADVEGSEADPRPGTLLSDEETQDLAGSAARAEALHAAQVAAASEDDDVRPAASQPAEQPTGSTTEAARANPEQAPSDIESTGEDAQPHGTTGAGPGNKAPNHNTANSDVLGPEVQPKGTDTDASAGDDASGQNAENADNEARRGDTATASGR